MTGLSTLSSHVCRCVRLGRHTCATPTRDRKRCVGKSLIFPIRPFALLAKFALSAFSFASPLAGACKKIHQECSAMAPVRRPVKKCPHGVTPTNCRQGCVGGAWCEHDVRRAGCRVCNAKDYCHRNRRVRSCKECSGCPHGFLPYHCRECGGGAFCLHDKYKHQCRECNGSAFCARNVRKSLCKTCRGNSFCEHNRQKSHCPLCQNFVCEIEGCPKQGQRFGAAYLLRQHMQKRHSDNPRAVTKSKELEVRQALCDAQIVFE